MIGATFIQHGIDEARRVVHHLVDETLAEVATEGPALDWKTSLTVKAHGMGFGEPRYQMSVSGPEYAQVFTANVMLQLAAAEKGWKALDNRKPEAQNVRKHRKHHHKHSGNESNGSNGENTSK